MRNSFISSFRTLKTAAESASRIAATSLPTASPSPLSLLPLSSTSKHHPPHHPLHPLKLLLIKLRMFPQFQNRILIQQTKLLPHLPLLLLKLPMLLGSLLRVAKRFASLTEISDQFLILTFDRLQFR